MAFKVVCGYPLPFEEQKYTLTGVVGKCGNLFWEAADIHQLLNRISIPKHITDYNMLQITGKLDCLSLKEQRRRRYFTHDHLIELLTESQFCEARNVAKRIENPETYISMIYEAPSVINFYNPTCIRLLNHISSQSFFVWYEFFKTTVMYELYGETIDSEWISSFISLAESSEASKDDKIFRSTAE